MSEFADMLAYINANLPDDSYYPKYVREVGSTSGFGWGASPIWQADDENPTHALVWHGTMLELDEDDRVAIRMRDVE